MTTQEKQFEQKLEVFRTEIESGMQFFYSHLAVHDVASSSKPVYRYLNQAPLFWNTILEALQTAVFITLGRVFDQKSSHNLDKLLNIAQRNHHIFSKAALARRKQGADPEPPQWLDEYLRHAYVPTAKDFRRLRRYVDKRRQIYNNNYRDIRHKVFAHKEVSDHVEVHSLFAKTNILELQRIFAFLSSLYGALWQLYFNGQKPVLRPQRYSAKRMRKLPAATYQKTLQEEITQETERFLLAAI